MLIVRRAGGVERVTTPGTWVGIRPQIRMMTIDSRITLTPGDRLVLYTDGIIEAADSRGEQFDMDRLTAVVEDTRHESLQGVVDAILARVRAFSNRQDDDMTVMVVDYQ
jgi:sigma-B regulation protein RsbU (phosphoserine phosphatase)